MLKITCEPIAFEAIKPQISAHLSALPAAIDSFLEDHIIKSQHYRIMIDDEYAGFTAIHQKNLVTQYSLLASFRHYGQEVFARIKKLAEVQAAFVPTCDEFFLAHALDEYRQLAKQAYFFAARPAATQTPAPSTSRLRHAQPSDIDVIQQESGDFFGDIASLIDKKQLFVTVHDDACVGFGIMEPSILINGVASIGMYVPERLRQRNIGTNTLRLLIDECTQRGLRPIAGCWYYNHNSKKTLQRAGLYSQTRLLKIDF